MNCLLIDLVLLPLKSCYFAVHSEATRCRCPCSENFPSRFQSGYHLEKEGAGEAACRSQALNARLWDPALQLGGTTHTAVCAVMRSVPMRDVFSMYAQVNLFVDHSQISAAGVPAARHLGHQEPLGQGCNIQALIWIRRCLCRQTSVDTVMMASPQWAEADAHTFYQGLAHALEHTSSLPSLAAEHI
jgi:hypothetical protein